MNSKQIEKAAIRDFTTRVGVLAGVPAGACGYDARGWTGVAFVAGWVLLFTLVGFAWDMRKFIRALSEEGI